MGCVLSKYYLVLEAVHADMLSYVHGHESIYMYRRVYTYTYICIHVHVQTRTVHVHTFMSMYILVCTWNRVNRRVCTILPNPGRVVGFQMSHSLVPRSTRARSLWLVTGSSEERDVGQRMVGTGWRRRHTASRADMGSGPGMCRWKRWSQSWGWLG